MENAPFSLHLAHCSLLQATALTPTIFQSSTEAKCSSLYVASKQTIFVKTFIGIIKSKNALDIFLIFLSGKIGDTVSSEKEKKPNQE